MNYLHNLCIPTEQEEWAELINERRTIYSTYYPFKLFPDKGLNQISFNDITIFYGGNGSGKTTLLNIVGEKMNILRHSEFSSSAFFNRYINLCDLEYSKPSEVGQFLSSDDVFDYIMNIRYLNLGIDNHREELIKGYTAIKKRVDDSSYYGQLHGLDDYDRFKEVCDVTDKNKGMSKYIKEQLNRNIDMFSNGETAMRYFTEHIDKNAIYLLDEPENSLSIEFQLELKKFIEDSVRFYNCQFVISTHSPILLSLNEARIYNLDEHPVACRKWTELPNVREYFEFFMNHSQEFLKKQN